MDLIGQNSNDFGLVKRRRKEGESEGRKGNMKESDGEREEEFNQGARIRC